MQVLEILNEVNSIVLWGAGYHTKEVLESNTSLFAGKNLYVVDKYKKPGLLLSGYPIMTTDSIDYNKIELVVIMTGIYEKDIKQELTSYGYNGKTIGLYEFRQSLSNYGGSTLAFYHINSFIDHMNNGTESYSYESMFKKEYDKYRIIKPFAFWASSIGESVRYINYYYHTEYIHKKEDEFYLLVPFINSKDFVNESFLEIISRELPMVTMENCHFWKYVMENYGSRLDYSSYNKENGIIINEYNYYDEMMCKLDLFNKKTSIIKYNKEEIDYGELELKRYGIDGEFVCIFARDSVFSKVQTNAQYSDRNNMRDMYIGDFIEATEYLESKNIKTVRMGKIVGSECNLPNCIDYATKYHQDFMDLYLISRCKFFAGSLSGIMELANLQDKPVLIIGLTLFGLFNGLTYGLNDYYIPKRVFDKNRKKYLNFKEMLDASDESGIEMQEYYDKRDLVFEDPSTNEVLEAVKEMNDRIDGVYTESERYCELIKKLGNIWDEWLKSKNRKGYYYNNKMKICESFLIKNSFLVE